MADEHTTHPIRAGEQVMTALVDFRAGFFRSLTGWAGRGVRAVRRSLVHAGAGRLGACVESGADLPP
jgi:hypothetical protein